MSTTILAALLISFAGIREALAERVARAMLWSGKPKWRAGGPVSINLGRPVALLQLVAYSQSHGAAYAR